MRYFTLINNSGETLDITTHTIFFNEVSGLGYEEETSFRHVGEVWWLNTASYRQQPIKGKLLFNNYNNADPYTEFRKFANFIQKVPLTLLYYPNDLSGKEYRKKVRVTKLEKSELNEYGVLEEDIEFTPYTPWFEIHTVKNRVEEAFDGAWIWGDGDTYPDVAFPEAPEGTIPTRFGAEESRWVSLKVESDVESPSKFVIYGPITNPIWTHYIDGKTVGSGEFTETIEIEDDEALVIDNTDEIGQIKVYSIFTDLDGETQLGEPLRDLYPKRNFNTKCFVTLRSGLNRIALSSVDTGSVRLMLEGHIYNATV